MTGYVRQGHAGLFLTRVSDIQCPRVEQCGYRCEAGRGGHDGPHLFEEHKHPSIEATPPPLDVDVLAVVLRATYGYKFLSGNVDDWRAEAEYVTERYAALTKPERILPPPPTPVDVRQHFPYGGPLVNGGQIAPSIDHSEQVYGAETTPPSLDVERVMEWLHDLDGAQRVECATGVEGHREDAMQFISGYAALTDRAAEEGRKARNAARAVATEDASGGYREVKGCGCEHCAALALGDRAVSGINK